MLPQILLIGATGRTGALVLNESLSRNHKVTILIRKPNVSLPQHANLTTITGDPCNAADVEKALLTATTTTPSVPIVIISTLGQTRASGNPWSASTSPRGFMAESAKAVLSAISSPQVVHSSIQVKKFVVMSMFGAGESFAQLNLLMRFTMNHSNMDVTLEDQNLVDGIVREGKVPFVLVRAAMLKEGEALPVKVYGNDGEGAGFMPGVTAKSVATFLVDVVGKDEFDGMTPVIAN